MNYSTRDQAEPLKSAIPEPPPLPEQAEIETLGNRNKINVNGKSQVMCPVWLNEIQSNKIFNKQKKITQCSDPRSENEIEINKNKNLESESIMK